MDGKDDEIEPIEAKKTDEKGGDTKSGEKGDDTESGEKHVNALTITSSPKKPEKIVRLAIERTLSIGTHGNKVDVKPLPTTLKVVFMYKSESVEEEPTKPFKELPIKVSSNLGPSMEAVDGVADFKEVKPGIHQLKINFTDPAQNKFDFVCPTEKDITLVEENINLAAGDSAVLTVEIEPLYTKVVFVAHCLLTIAKQTWNGVKWESQYSGLAPESADIDARVKMLSDVIKKAAGKVGNKPEELKVFAVPECFFLGRNGAYTVNALSSLIEKLQDLVKEPEWKHWLFVFGTVNSTYEDEEGGFSELLNISPAIRGGFGAMEKAPDYTKLVRKTFYSEEMAKEADLIVPAGESPHYGEEFDLDFGSTEYEYMYGRLVLELLGLVWDGKIEDWVPRTGGEPTIPFEEPDGVNAPKMTNLTIDDFCVKKGWTKGSWKTLRDNAKDLLDHKGLLYLVRDIREQEKPGWDEEKRFKQLVSWYVKGTPVKAKEVPEAVLSHKADFYREDFTFQIARKPGALLKKENTLPINRKIRFGLEICADHSRSRVKNSPSEEDRKMKETMAPTAAKVKELADEKTSIDKHLKDFVPEKEGLEKIIPLLKAGELEEAKKLITQTFGQALNPDTMDALMKERTERLDYIKVRKPKLEEELKAARAEQTKLTQQKTEITKKQEIDIHLVPSAGMTLLTGNVAMRPNGYAFNCDGWNASSIQYDVIRDRGAKILEINKEQGTTHALRFSPHSEVLKSPMTLPNRVRANNPVIELKDEDGGLFTTNAANIFGEGPGQLHIYPPQDLPN